MKRLPIAILLLIVILPLLVLGVTLFISNKQLASLPNLSISPTPIPSPAAGDDISNDVLKVNKLTDKYQYWFVAEFLEEPKLSRIANAYTVRASIPVGQQTTRFDVILGSKDGNTQSGTCEYNRSNSQFNDNNTFFTEDTKILAERIKTGTKAILRFELLFKDVNTQSGRKILDDLNRITKAASANQAINSVVFLAPIQLCIAKPL